MTPSADPDRRSALVRLVGFVATLGVIALLALLVVPVSRAGIEHVVRGFGPFAPVAFVVISTLLALLFVPGPLLAAAGGALFGTWSGLAVSVAASVLTSVLAVVISRRFGAGPVRTLSGRRALALAELAQRRGIPVVVLQRLIPGLPDAPFSYLFGALRVPLTAVAVGTLVGAAPRAFTYAALGRAGTSGDGTLAAVAIGVGVATAVVGLIAGAVVVRRQRRRG